VSTIAKLQMEAIVKSATKERFVVTYDLTTDDKVFVQGEVENDSYTKIIRMIKYRIYF
ncbi:uncharacterized protein METZ01_LOCUS377527, partial [marine metagenome]